MVATCTAGGTACGDFGIDLALTSPVTPHWTGIVAGVVGVTAAHGVNVVFSGPGSATARANMTVRVSVDDGKSWGVPTAVWVGPAGYSDLAFVGGTSTAAAPTVALIFENGDTTFADRVSVQILTVA
jgi:hypothetical protein